MSFSQRHSLLIKPILDLPAFQRLRHIKQLGLVQLVFPGAVNTRFNHCLGACYLANLISKQLNIGSDLNDIAIVSALIHDIGHGPFSHLFERILPDAKKIKHDREWLDCFLQQFRRQNILSSEQLTACRSVFSLEDRPDELCVVSDIVSSQLDADRLDYLLRDSYYCGVTYGRFNLEWLLSCMHQVSVEGVNRLGVVQKGMGALEHYIMSRRLMTKNIYANGKINGARYYLQSFLKLLSSQMDRAALESTRKTLLGQYCLLLNRYSNDQIDKASFLERSFGLYQQLVDDDIWMILREFATSSRNDELNCLARRIYYRQLPHAISIGVDEIGRYRQIVSQFFEEHSHVANWQCKIEQLDFVAYEKHLDPIYIEGASPLFDFLSENTEPSYWLYVDREIMSEFLAYTSTKDFISSSLRH